MKTEAELKKIIESAKAELFNLRKIEIKALYEQTKHTWLADYSRDAYYYLNSISSVLDQNSVFSYIQVQRLREKLAIEIQIDHFAAYDGETFGDGFISFCNYPKVIDKSVVVALDNLLNGYLPFKNGSLRLG